MSFPRGCTLNNKLRILFVGNLSPHRQASERRDALIELGHCVQCVDTKDIINLKGIRRFSCKWSNRLFRLGITQCGLPEFNGENASIIAHIKKSPFDVLWLERPRTIRGDTLQRVRELQPSCVIAGYTNDEMILRRANSSRQFLECLPLYDVFFTTKSHDVAPLQAAGCPRCEYIQKGFMPSMHRPVSVTATERATLGGPVGFVGTWERERAESMRKLAKVGIPVRIWGSDWQKCRRPHPQMKIEFRPVYREEYAKTLCSFDIGLCFLRKYAFDKHTARSIEIPACGAFMLAERTQEHLDLFEEGKEAEFFACDEELLDKVGYYLSHSAERKRIALAGRERCLRSGYSHQHRLKTMLNTIATMRVQQATRKIA